MVRVVSMRVGAFMAMRSGESDREV
jgi:hypothetical protein